MTTEYKIGATQAKTHDNDEHTGVARFTINEYESGQMVGSHTVELSVRFDPETKKWELSDLKQWEGKF